MRKPLRIHPYMATMLHFLMLSLFWFSTTAAPLQQLTHVHRPSHASLRGKETKPKREHTEEHHGRDRLEQSKKLGHVSTIKRKIPKPDLNPKRRPNLVFFLTDDQDQMLGGSFPVLEGQATPMPKTKKLMQDEGMYAEHFYAHTPICSPSRSELLTGRYFHNLKQKGGAGYCHGMHVNHNLVHNNTFLRVLQEEGGYSTALFGKYVNRMPPYKPLGFDGFFANDGSSYIAPEFTVDGITGFNKGHVRFNNNPGNYSTSVIGNVSIQWIREVAATGKPFMAYIAPKSAHEPFNPAPWYRDHWDPSWPDTEPRPVNWNCSLESRAGHHGNIKTMPYLTDQAAKVVTGIFKNRWRTLMSVDDLIADVIKAVDDLGLSNSTYFLFSSDHGFQLGQFNIPMDKRHVYEWDTKVHLLIRGPGIQHGSKMVAPATLVDIAPTMLGLAGFPSEEMDGRSFVPFLFGADRISMLPNATRVHWYSVGPIAQYRQDWREEVFLEYYFCSRNVKCINTACGNRGQFPESDSFCTDLKNNKDCWCPSAPTDHSIENTCYVTETEENNFIALRRPGGIHMPENWLYAEFQVGNMARENINFTDVQFREYFNLHKDPWHMTNHVYKELLHQDTAAGMSKRMRQWLQCSGKSCP